MPPSHDHDHTVGLLVMYNMLKLVKNAPAFTKLSPELQRAVVETLGNVPLSDIPACDREEAMGYLKQRNIRAFAA
jgi:lipoate-protein ligase B